MAREGTRGLDEAKVEEKGLEAIGRGERMTNEGRPERRKRGR